MWVKYHITCFHFACFLSGIGHVGVLDYIAFLSCLEFAVLNSENQNTIFKTKQVICLENVYLEKDVMCVLPTGYGKSLIFHLLPMLLFAKFKLCGDLINE